MEKNSEDCEKKTYKVFEKLYPKTKEDVEKGIQKTFSDFDEEE